MRAVTAILQHLLLVMTLRHDGRGLPRTSAPWACLVLLACLMAWARWGALTAPISILLFLVLVGVHNRPLSAGMALVSMGVDLASLSGLDRQVLFAWEITSYLALAIRHLVSRVGDQPHG